METLKRGLDSAESDDFKSAVLCDTISAEELREDFVRARKRVEMETLKKRGVCENRPAKECWERTGKRPTGVVGRRRCRQPGVQMPISGKGD